MSIALRKSHRGSPPPSGRTRRNASSSIASRFAWRWLRSGQRWRGRSGRYRAMGMERSFEVTSFDSGVMGKGAEGQRGVGIWTSRSVPIAGPGIVDIVGMDPLDRPIGSAARLFIRRPVGVRRRPGPRRLRARRSPSFSAGIRAARPSQHGCRLDHIRARPCHPARRRITPRTDSTIRAVPAITRHEGSGTLRRSAGNG